MSAASYAKLAWLGLVIGAVVSVSLVRRETPVQASSLQPTAASTLVSVVDLSGGLQGLVDRGGHVTPLRRYERIGSGSTVADELLLALSEPERLVMLTDYGRTHAPRKYLWGQRSVSTRPADVESLRTQKLDLFILNHYGPPSELARVRAAGIEVFNLGDMRGMATLPANIEAVATLLGDRSRGHELIASLQRRMRAVAADIPAAKRKRAVYVSAYAGQLFGGAEHTSYHDVLTAAGLIDVATPTYRDWVKYDPEQLLALDPELIVTSTPSVPQLCQIHGLDHLHACLTPGGIVGLDDALLGNPGLGMLDAAELIRERVYGPMRQTGP